MKVLILHTSEGYGPKVVAQNITEYLKTNTDWDVRITDAMRADKSRFVELWRNAYFKIYQQLGFLWGFIYHSRLIHNSLAFRLRYLSARKGQKVLEEIQDFQPDIIVSTQTFSSAIAAYAKRQGIWRGQLGIVFSDYHFHRFWAYPEADFYFCVTEAEVAALKSLGIPDSRVLRVGIPIHEKFFVTQDWAECFAHFGIQNTVSPIVTVTGGRRALQAAEAVIRELLKLKTEFQVVLVCGKNEEMKARFELLKKENNYQNLHILGFVDHMEKLMAITSILISKPGGPTISEAAAMSVPVVVTDAHPGHEMANYKYLTVHGFAKGSPDPREVARLTGDWLFHPKAREQQGQYARGLVDPMALSKIRDFLGEVSKFGN